MLARYSITLLFCLLFVPSVCVAEAASDLPEGVDDEWLAAVQDYIGSEPEAAATAFTPENSGWSAEGDKFEAEFGYSVATAGDFNGDGYSDVIVGAPYYALSPPVATGRVWLFLGGSDGLATTGTWTGGVVDGEEFGYSVACAGDVNGDGFDDIVVGAPGLGAGYAYVYYGSSSGSLGLPEWHDSGKYENSVFGYSVSTAGDYDNDGYDDILVGDPNTSGGDGFVFVYFGSDDGLDRGHYLIHVGRPGSRLGYSVSSAGDINGDGRDDWIAGAPYDSLVLTVAGAVKVAYGGVGATWINGDYAYAGFGRYVSLAGDVDGDGYADILVSCQTTSYGSMEDSRTRLYLGDDTGLLPTPAWTVFNTEDPHYGFQVATAGDVNGDGFADVLLGCPTIDYNGNIDSGEARLYLGGKSGLTSDPEWTTSIKQPGALLGSVAAAGDVDGDGYSDILIGASGYDGTYTDAGLVDCYFGSGEGLSEEPDWTTESDHDQSLYGWSVASAGDVNGDGYDDVLVGSAFEDNGELNEGMAYLYHGSMTGLSTIPAWTAEGNQAQCGFGTSVASAGDVNGDGYADILIGAPYMDDTAALEGAVFLWFGQRYSMPDGTPANADWSYYSGQYQAWFGSSVACAGDVNGDGLSDIVIGAPKYDAGTTDEGGVFVFHGSPTGPGTAYNWFHDTAKASCSYGASVASAGDMNGDGFSDIIVGAPDYDHPGAEIGLAFVYIGSESGLVNGAPWWYAAGDEAEGHFGCSVASAGDVNGDGYSDVIIGAKDQDSSVVDSGMCFAWYGGATPPPSGTPANADWSIGFFGEVHLGWSVASAGDVNNDGYSDVVVGAPDGNGQESRAGWAMTFLGSDTGLETSHDSWVFGDGVNGFLGRSVASAGDVNGDGFCDVVAGAPFTNNGQIEEGRAYLFNGGGGEGLRRLPRQLKSDNHTPLCPLNRSDSSTAFGLELEMRSPAGRESVRADFEVRPHGDPFSIPNVVSLVWTDTGAPYYNEGSSVELEQSITGLNIGTRYKWRLRTVSRNPFFPRSPWFTLARNGLAEADLRTATFISAVGDEPVRASGLQVGCYPNPFNPRTTIRYAVTEAGPVRLRLFDLAGRLVADLVDQELPAGEYGAVWNGKDATGSDVASGMYLIRLENAGAVRVGRAALVR